MAPPILFYHRYDPCTLCSAQPPCLSYVFCCAEEKTPQPMFILLYTKSHHYEEPNIHSQRGGGSFSAPRDFIKWTVQWENLGCCQKGRPRGPTHFRSFIFINVVVYPLSLATQTQFQFQKCSKSKGRINTRDVLLKNSSQCIVLLCWGPTNVWCVQLLQNRLHT